MTVSTALDVLLADYDALEELCANEEWDLAEQQMDALNTRVRAIEWSERPASDLQSLIERQQRLAVTFISGREQAATLLKRLALSQKARSHYGQNPPR